MKCDIMQCNKDITEGKFIPNRARMKSPEGEKDVTLFMVACLACIEQYGLQDKVQGHITIKEDENEKTIHSDQTGS